MLTDENKAYKQELTALKAKLEMEKKELLKDEKKAYEKEFSALKATLEDKLVAQGKEEAGGVDNQAKQGVKHGGEKKERRKQRWCRRRGCKKTSRSATT